MKKDLLLIVIILFFAGCVRNVDDVENERSAYFVSGDLSAEPFTDSIMVAEYSTVLNELNELPMRSRHDVKSSYRLMVTSVLTNPYSIRIDDLDSVIAVIIQVGGDPKNVRRMGLRNLTIAYSSSDVRMDSMFNALYKNLKAYGFETGIDTVEYETADGISYVLESVNDGKYSVVYGKRGGSYEGRDELLALADRMHAFMPDGIIPNMYHARVLDDVIFNVFRRDSLRQK
jgi:hypothetical protein